VSRKFVEELSPSADGWHHVDHGAVGCEPQPGAYALGYSMPPLAGLRETDAHAKDSLEELLPQDATLEAEATLNPHFLPHLDETRGEKPGESSVNFGDTFCHARTTENG